MLSHDASPELIDVINDRDETVGVVERRLSYARGLSHRIVHVMIERQGRLFVVRRSLTTRYLPGYFCTSAGGHVLAGESITQAAARELQEEVGVSGKLQHVDTFSFYHEFRVSVSLFVLQTNSVVMTLNEHEVMSGDFYSPEALDALDRALFHPQLDICIAKARTYLKLGLGLGPELEVSK